MTLTTPPKTPISPRWSSPLASLDGKPFPSHGAKVCTWIERHCVYGEGDWFGRKVKLRPWQRRFIKRLYQYDPETKRRIYRRALLGMAKGNGKSPLAAWIGAYELLGGRQITPRVMIGAASLKQANLVFGDLKTAITESPTLSDLVEAQDLQIVLKDPRHPGLAERVAAEAATNDGARGTCFLADELHEFTGRLARVYMVLEGAITKRQNAFSLGISTAGVLSNPKSLLQGLYDDGCKIATGESVDAQFLFEWYEADSELDLDDEAQWLEAVRQANPAADDFLDVESLRYRFRKMPRYEFERYHLNRWTSTAVQWLPAGGWEDCESPGEIAHGSRVVLAFRGSYANDRAALVACDESGRVQRLAWFESRDENLVVSPDEVDAAIDQAFRTFKVARMVCVRTGWHTSVESWAERYGQELVVAYPMSKPRRVEACSRFYAGVVNKQILHDGDPVMARQLSEATVRNTEYGAYIVEDAGRAIEVGLCAVMAYEQASVVEEALQVATLVTF